MAQFPRVHKLSITEGDPIPLAAYVTGPDNVTAMTNATSGQPGVSSIDVAIYDRAPGAPQSQTALYSTTLLPGGATWDAAAGIMHAAVIGDGYTEDPRGHNFLYLLQGDDALAVIEGCSTPQIEVTFHRTGKTPASTGVAWGSTTETYDVAVLSRYSA